MRSKLLFLTVACVVLSFVGATAHAQNQCPAGTIGYWPLDGDGTEQVNGFPGVLVNNVTFGPGMVGQAAAFDGQFSYIDAGQHAELTDFGGDELSFTAWLRPQPDAQNSHSVVVTARTNCNEGNWQFYDRLSGTVYISKWFSGDESFFNSTQTLPNGVWSHVAVTYAAGVANFYVNGAFVEQVTDDFVIGINDFVQNVQVGYDSCSDYYTGEIDELAVYGRELTAAEIQDQYLSGLAGVSICVPDADGDGVLDDQDVCPDTSGDPLVEGCDCDQILAFKPGKGGRCDAGTLNVFSRRIGWAKDVPVPGGGS